VLTQATKEVEEGVLSATAVEEQPEEETSADQTQIQDLSMDKEIQTQPKTQQGAMQQNHTNQENNAQHDTSNDVAFLQNLMNRATNIRPEVTVTAPPQIVDTESILKQMMDYMKLHISPNITEMEIQLQPANLGSINLQVATRNGVVTAQLTAETEAVKKALESQVVQLRESLNEQGIKIEAVEVTIASHSFERNLEQGGDSTPYEDTDSTTKGNGRSKRLVLGELDEEAEAELEEEDKIQVQMMKQNGNSVNLTA
ncbi:MAG: flagellar hook-length control protein FliK, partial [Lachnospiraceae bacterium]